MTPDEPPAFRLLPDADEVDLDAEQLPVPPAGFSRRTKLAAGWLAVALLLAGGGLRLNQARHAAQLARSRPEAAAPSGGTGAQDVAASLPQWPHASVGVCGGPGGLLPILTAKPLDEPTGVRLTVGSSGVRTVELDTGAVSGTPQVSLREGSLVLDRRTVAGTSYLVVNSCGGGLRVLAYAPGRFATNVATDIATTTLFGDSTDGVWTASFTPGTALADAQLQVRMVRLDRPGSVLLPANTFPLALSGHLIVGETISAAGQQGPSLVVFDSARHRVVRNLGLSFSLTQSRGVVVWTSQPCSAATPCQLHTFDVRTGRSTARGYSLPVEAGVAGGALSPDGTRLAFQLPRMSDEPRYSTDIPGAPSDLVVLELASGVLEPVPNLEVPPGSELGLTFSADSKWLVAAVGGKDGPQLLAWRSGLSYPLASPARLPGPAPDPLPFLAAPAG